MIVAGVFVLAVILVLFFALRGRVGQEESEALKGPDVFRPGNLEALPTVEGGTREIIKEEIATPELGSTDAPEGVAVPTNVSQLSGPGGEISLRDFEIRAEGGKYVPATIVVNDGDVVKITFTAVDADYDIFIPDFGVLAVAKEGGVVKTQFQAAPFGEYEFFCKNCGDKTEGRLIVNERP